jgi:hypothetical protein
LTCDKCPCDRTILYAMGGCKPYIIKAMTQERPHAT